MTLVAQLTDSVSCDNQKRPSTTTRSAHAGTYYAASWAAVALPVMTKEVAPSRSMPLRWAASSARKLLISRPNSTMMLWWTTRSMTSAGAGQCAERPSEWAGDVLVGR